MLHSGVRSEQDAALALLSEHLENKSVPLKTSAIIGFVSPLARLLYSPSLIRITTDLVLLMLVPIVKTWWLLYFRSCQMMQFQWRWWGWPPSHWASSS